MLIYLVSVPHNVIITLFYYLEGYRLHIVSEFPSPLIIERYGINGTICPLAWDDNDASVLCRENGYHGGVAFLDEYPRYHSNMLLPQCNGTELSLSDCASETDIFICRDDLLAFMDDSSEIFCFFGSGIYTSP